MIFGTRKTIEGIFDKHYKHLLKICEKSHNSDIAIFEILPAIFVVTTYASLDAGLDSDTIGEIVMQEIISRYPSYEVDKFKTRFKLYISILNETKKLRCEYVFGHSYMMFGNDPVQKCAALFADILYNPKCADSYDDTPLILCDTSYALDFTEKIVVPLVEEFTKLYKDIYKFNGKLIRK